MEIDGDRFRHGTHHTRTQPHVDPIAAPSAAPTPTPSREVSSDRNDVGEPRRCERNPMWPPPTAETARGPTTERDRHGVRCHHKRGSEKKALDDRTAPHLNCPTFTTEQRLAPTQRTPEQRNEQLDAAHHAADASAAVASSAVRSEPTPSYRCLGGPLASLKHV